MKTIHFYWLMLHAVCIIGVGCSHPAIQQHYRGTVFSDSDYIDGEQAIPGKIQCEYYDLGGEGIAYHDENSVNSGSGALNPLNGTYLHGFRVQEGVDTSFTKPAPVDDHEYNQVAPQMKQLYIGWTQPGEWTRYSIQVKETGLYQVGMMYTCNGAGQISLDIDGRDCTGPITVASTHDDRDPIDWRQWHHWNYAENLAEIHLEKGRHILTLHTVANGNMNYDYLQFSKQSEAVIIPKP